MSNQYENPEADEVHITHINDTRANLTIELDKCQIAIITDNEAFPILCFKDHLGAFRELSIADNLIHNLVDHGDFDEWINQAVRTDSDVTFNKIGVGTLTPQSKAHIYNPLNIDTFLQIGNGVTGNNDSLDGMSLGVLADGSSAIRTSYSRELAFLFEGSDEGMPLIIDKAASIALSTRTNHNPYTLRLNGRIAVGMMVDEPEDNLQVHGPFNSFIRITTDSTGINDGFVLGNDENMHAVMRGGYDGHIYIQDESTPGVFDNVIDFDPRESTIRIDGNEVLHAGNLGSSVVKLNASNNGAYFQGGTWGSFGLASVSAKTSVEIMNNLYQDVNDIDIYGTPTFKAIASGSASFLRLFNSTLTLNVKTGCVAGQAAPSGTTYTLYHSGNLTPPNQELNNTSSPTFAGLSVNTMTPQSIGVNIKSIDIRGIGTDASTSGGGISFGDQNEAKAYVYSLGSKLYVSSTGEIINTSVGSTIFSVNDIESALINTDYIYAKRRGFTVDGAFLLGSDGYAFFTGTKNTYVTSNAYYDAYAEGGPKWRTLVSGTSAMLDLNRAGDLILYKNSYVGAWGEITVGSIGTYTVWHSGNLTPAAIGAAAKGKVNVGSFELLTYSPTVNMASYHVNISTKTGSSFLINNTTAFTSTFIEFYGASVGDAVILVRNDMAATVQIPLISHPPEIPWTDGRQIVELSNGLTMYCYKVDVDGKCYWSAYEAMQ